MHPLIHQIERTVFAPCGLAITDIVKDAESEEYHGYDLQCNNNIRIKFRLAKLTPKKVGNFVALWKRSSAGVTEPFEHDDPFDYYLVAVQSENTYGLFFFPKYVLAKNGILTHEGKEGKRGFRLYPDWVKAPNRQAEKTQLWQSPFFIPLEEGDSNAAEKLRHIRQLK
ncbi:MepB family protein [Chitinophaga deserti]|uniref:MepB family protein n=1 Tax=Chitinophaga deserti TaxID=2164099 RepID=UPI000D6A7F3B|nr:MepB family protein [Chitinophaga deserti]